VDDWELGDSPFAGSLVPGLVEPSTNEETLTTGTQAVIIPTRRSLILGRQEFNTRVVYGAAVTEANATFLWLYFHIGIVNVSTSGGYEHPEVWISIGHFMLIALLTYSFAAPSGAHFNPNITLATMAIGMTTVWRFVCYAIGQVVGGTLGAVAMRITLGWEGVTPAAMAACNVGNLNQPQALLCNTVLFHFLLSIIGGIAFDPRQARLFGPVLAPPFIAAAVALLMWASSKLQGNFGPMLNSAECIAISIAVGEWNGTEWISFVGPLLGTFLHSTLYILIPPSHQVMSARYRAPVLQPRYPESAESKHEGEHSSNAGGAVLTA